MLKVMTTTVSKEATVETELAKYQVIYTSVNDVLGAISCSIRRRYNDQGEQEVGVIRKENGQINSNILDSEDIVVHHVKFKEILDEIDVDLV